MAGDGEEKIVVERRELGQGVAELLWCRLSNLVEIWVVLLKFDGKRVLEFLRKNLRGELAQPGLQHTANGIGIVQLLLREQIDVKLCIVWSAMSFPNAADNHTLIEAALPVLDLRTTAWHTVQALRLAVQIEEAVSCQYSQRGWFRRIEYSLNATPRQTRHPKLGLILRSFDPL